MCGICGIINFDKKSVKEKLITDMMYKMKHRGPDDEGTFYENGVGLGFVRLSVIDLSSAGHQPMFSKDERFVIIFNGEVYNYIEIRNELKSKYTFISNTDTEVVLYSYIEWGAECLKKFNGMFAFVIYDRVKKEFFGARDRFGIKPFYYYKNESQLIFASDIPPILISMGKKASADDEVIFNYLLINRTNYSENTFFSDIKKLRPGHYFIVKDKSFIINRWYNIKDEIIGKGFNESKEYYECFKDAIKLQLRSDVPVGICLSGGLDSSAIASVLLKDFKPENLHSYSAVYNQGENGDEQEYLNEFLDSAINMHYTKPTYNDLLKDIDRYIEALVEPVPSTSEYAEFKVMELAKKHSTVILNGQGADEVLGGYDYFYGAYLLELLKNFNLDTFLKEFLALRNSPIFYKSLYYMIFFFLPINVKVLILLKKNNFIKKSFYKKFRKNSIELIKKLYEFQYLRDFFINHLEHKFEHHLIWADKSGMYFSLETRFPFIDHRLIERTLSTNQNKILFSGWTKYILREALKNILPDKIRERKNKIGFETPLNEWFREKDFTVFLNSIICSKTFNNRPYFESKEVKKMFEKHLLKKADYSNTIWKIIHLELWLRKFID